MCISNLRTEPCDTRYDTDCLVDSWPPKAIWYELSDRQERLNSLLSWSVRKKKNKYVAARSGRWTQSKAVESSNSLNVICHWSAAIKMSDQTRNIAVSVECPFCMGTGSMAEDCLQPSSHPADWRQLTQSTLTWRLNQLNWVKLALDSLYIWTGNGVTSYSWSAANCIKVFILDRVLVTISR